MACSRCWVNGHYYYCSCSSILFNNLSQLPCSEQGDTPARTLPAISRRPQSPSLPVPQSLKADPKRGSHCCSNVPHPPVPSREIRLRCHFTHPVGSLLFPCKGPEREHGYFFHGVLLNQRGCTVQSMSGSLTCLQRLPFGFGTRENPAGAGGWARPP